MEVCPAQGQCQEEGTLQALQWPATVLTLGTNSGWPVIISQNDCRWNIATSSHLDVADYPAMSFFFVCWHSRKWWRPICGGTLQSPLLRLEKIKWIKCFCKKSISHTNCRYKSKKHDKNGQKPYKNLFVSYLSQNSWNEWSLKIEIPKTRYPSK